MMLEGENIYIPGIRKICHVIIVVGPIEVSNDFKLSWNELI